MATEPENLGFWSGERTESIIKRSSKGGPAAAAGRKDPASGRCTAVHLTPYRGYFDGRPEYFDRPRPAAAGVFR
jgi:hypothetical protein